MDNPRISNLANIKKFDDINFTHWQTKIQLILMQYNVWRLIKGCEPKPEGSDLSPLVITWSDKNDRALAIIGLGLGNNYIHHLNLESTADVVWENLNTLFGKDLNNSILFLKQRFYKMNVVNAPSLKEHLNAMSILIQQLAALKCPLDDNDRKGILLNSLEDHDESTEVLGGCWPLRRIHLRGCQLARWSPGMLSLTPMHCPIAHGLPCNREIIYGIPKGH